MKVAAIQSNYLPWKGYFDIIRDVDVFVFYDEVQYTKNDWRNRNQIYAKSGPLWLTIPIAKEAVNLKVSEVKLSQNAWQEQHFKSVTHTYSSAPYFSQLKPLIDELYLNHKWEKLIDVNRFAIRKISDMLGIKTRFEDLAAYKVPEGRIERLVGLLTSMGATTYVSGPSGKDYLEEHTTLFEKNNIALEYKDYSSYPSYKQRGASFIDQVSIIDMIANVKISQIPELIWGWRAASHELRVSGA